MKSWLKLNLAYFTLWILKKALGPCEWKTCEIGHKGLYYKRWLTMDCPECDAMDSTAIYRLPDSDSFAHPSHRPDRDREGASEKKLTGPPRSDRPEKDRPFA